MLGRPSPRQDEQQHRRLGSGLVRSSASAAAAFLKRISRTSFHGLAARSTPATRQRSTTLPTTEGPQYEPGLLGTHILGLPVELAARVVAHAGLAPVSSRSQPQLRAVFEFMLSDPPTLCIWLTTRYGANSSLVRAAVGGKAKVVQRLLAMGADVHAWQDEALRSAATLGHAAVVHLLLDSGADVHAESDQALWLASGRGHHAVVRQLLRAGAHVHACDDQALRAACAKGRFTVVAVLLEAGADVHALQDEALQWAARRGHLNVVTQLLQAGADPNAWNGIALQLATAKGHHAVAAKLRSAAARVRAVGQLEGAGQAAATGRPAWQRVLMNSVGRWKPCWLS